MNNNAAPVLTHLQELQAEYNTLIEEYIDALNTFRNTRITLRTNFSDMDYGVHNVTINYVFSPTLNSIPSEQ